MKITKIELGESLSGNAGCNNGNYDIPVTITFDNGKVYNDCTCNCCCGCCGTFPFRWLVEAVLRKGIPDDATFPYGIYGNWFETGIFPSGVLEFSDMDDFMNYIYPEEEDDYE